MKTTITELPSEQRSFSREEILRLGGVWKRASGIDAGCIWITKKYTPIVCIIRDCNTSALRTSLMDTSKDNTGVGEIFHEIEEMQVSYKLAK